ncbi:MAG TPA: dTDP-4-dehydrorhamnose 3,5-epimerase family protein [Oligoflexia bacterium]|nr:dTDP-4-dehydrorhamnose 3,5-epimerase family protein [Oligoflexia bacterium]HMP26930.1 dTDP-4-dehydrorhamnose 3,5-epimerase family protein [Oligoflexia bacterium]
MNNIVGVEIKELKTHRDERGFFRELIRFNDPFFSLSNGKTLVKGEDSINPFAQWSHSKMIKDVVKAWHYHHKQIDWWYISGGVVLAVLVDWREESPTYKKRIELLMGCGDSKFLAPPSLGTEIKNIESQIVREICVKIPPGVLHGLRVLSDSAEIMYITSEIYDPSEEGRLPFDSPEVGFDWGEGALVVDNDKRFFLPKSERRLLY